MMPKDASSLPLDGPTLIAKTEEVARQDFSKDSQERWALIYEIQKRAETIGLDAAQKWCQDDHPLLRCLGADVLSQFGDPTDPALQKTVEGSLNTLLDDPNTDVIACALVAFGHRGVRDFERIASFAHHTSSEIRQGVVFALYGKRHPVAESTLIALSKDDDPDVQEGATFALGVASDIDTPEIRLALSQRLELEEDEIRLEAMLGLARRKDPKVIAPIAEELTKSQVWGLAIAAAQSFPQAEFIAPLRKLSHRHPDLAILREALAACETQAPT